MRNFRLTSFTLLLLGVILNSCSKNSNEGDVVRGGGADDQYKIVITTTKAIGEKIYLGYDPFTKSDRIWIDFNNNGIREKGEFRDTDGGHLMGGIVGSQTITIYGKVAKLDLYNSKITSIDTSKGIYLEALDVGENPIETLDLTHNPKLKELDAWPLDPNDEENGIRLKSLSISAEKNPELEDILLYAEGIETLDISNFSKLRRLWIDGSVKNLKIANNPNMKLFSPNDLFAEIELEVKNLEIHNNATIEELRIRADKVESIDVSNSPNLERLSIRITDTNSDLQKVKLLNTPKLEAFRITSAEMFDISLLCVQIDARRIIPTTGWIKGKIIGKKQISMNYQSTPCL